MLIKADGFSQRNTVFSGYKYRWGFSVSYGPKKFGESIEHINHFYHLRDYYQVYIFKYQFYYSLHRRKKWGVDFLLQPQYNLTKYREYQFEEKMHSGHEFGINPGIVVRYNFLFDFISYYAVLSIGPHYTSNTPDIQANGFIFSDNLFCGADIRLEKNTYLDIQLGFRHISNAGLKSPNRGINNILMGVGFIINFNDIKSKIRKTGKNSYEIA